MRLAVCSSLIVLGLAAACPASAQESEIARGVRMHDDALQTQAERPRDPYTEAMVALKAKLLQQTQADGGKLTPEHQASIQKELEAINQRYRKTAKR